MTRPFLGGAYVYHYHFEIVPIILSQRDRAGRVSRRLGQGRHALHHVFSVPQLHKDDHQRRHHTCDLRRGLSDGRLFHPPLKRGRHHGHAAYVAELECHPECSEGSQVKPSLRLYFNTIIEHSAVLLVFPARSVTKSESLSVDGAAKRSTRPGQL